MHFSKCLTKANTWKTYELVQLARVFQGQTLLRKRRRNTDVNHLLLLLKKYWMKYLLSFFLSINLVGFQQKGKDMLQQAQVWLLHWKYENSRMKSASVFFPSGLSVPQIQLHRLFVGCACARMHMEEWQLHHFIWSVQFPPCRAGRRISARLVNPFVHI